MASESDLEIGSPEDVARVTGLPLWKVRERVAAGTLPALPRPPGKRTWEIPMQALRRYLAGEAVDPKLFERPHRQEAA
jgi:hypothetical protein